MELAVGTVWACDQCGAAWELAAANPVEAWGQREWRPESAVSRTRRGALSGVATELGRGEG